MSYPAFPVHPKSAVEMLADTRLRRASNGLLRGRVMWPAPRRRFRLVHELLHADVEALRAFFAANMGVTFDFTWPADAVVYSVAFEVPPTARHIGGLWWEVSVVLVEG